MQTVIFACVHNAGRSQMAAAFFNALADPAKARVERGHIEDLLMRIEALAEASQPGAGETPPPPQVARA